MLYVGHVSSVASSEGGHVETTIASAYRASPLTHLIALDLFDYTWQVYGEGYLSWVWVDTGDAEVTKEVVRLSSTVGTPVRSAGELAGHASVYVSYFAS